MGQSFHVGASPIGATGTRHTGNGILTRMAAALARRRLYGRTLNELRRLSDHELADLGIARSAITSVAHEAVYGRHASR